MKNYTNQLSDQEQMHTIKKFKNVQLQVKKAHMLISIEQSS